MVNSVVVNGSIFRSMTSGVPQESVLGLVFNAFMSDTDSEIECTLIKFADRNQAAIGLAPLRSNMSSKRPWTSSRRGLTGISWDSARPRANLSWIEVTPSINIGWGMKATESSPAKKYLEVLVD